MIIRNGKKELYAKRNGKILGLCYRNAKTTSSPSIPATPGVPVLDFKTYNSIQVVYSLDNEYSKDNSTWQDSPLFESLLAETEYNIYQRVKATETTSDSLSSLPLSVTTEEAPVMMTNILGTDGNMNDVTTVDSKPDGWVYSTANAVSCVENEVVFIATAINGYIRKRPTLVVGHKYYGCAYLKSNTASSRVEFASDYSAHSGGGDYEFLGALATCSATSNQLAIKDTRSSAWDNLTAKLAFLFDLTDIFGAGNEPTKTQMNDWMSYWVGVNGYAESVPYGTPPVEPPTYGEPWAVEYTKPDATNTGYGETVLTADSGIIALNTSNAVYEGKNLSGYVTVGANADNLTIRNCKITPPDGSYYGVQIFSGTNITIENCEIDMSACLSTGSAAIVGNKYIAKKCHIHDCGADGIKLGNDVTVEDCFIERLGRRVGAHADGMQLSGGSNVVIHRNNIHMPSGVEGFIATSNFMIKPDSADIDNVLIEYNWLNGGGYTVYVTDATNYESTDAIVRNNRFGRDYNYGVKQLTASAGVGWTNNVWVDTNILIP